jgi:hypothetical protein
MRRIFLTIIAVLPLLVAACASEPGARSLDEIEAPSAARAPISEPQVAAAPLTEADARPAAPAVATPKVRAEESTATASTAGPSVPRLPAGHYEALELKKVKGGRLSLEFPGTPESIGAKLIDFGDTARHRAWAERFEMIEAGADSLKVRWHFEGKAGVNPAPVLEFQVRRRAPDFYCRFRIVEEDFGLAAFFGDYHVVALADDEQGRPRSRFSQRVYIDSGLWIANASAEEIEAGLREDARLLLAWIMELPNPSE